MHFKLFNEIVNIPDHKLAYLLPHKPETKYDLRQSRVFTDYTVNTNRFCRRRFAVLHLKVSRNRTDCTLSII